jgi:hypothetical protein
VTRTGYRQKLGKPFYNGNDNRFCDGHVVKAVLRFLIMLKNNIAECFFGLLMLIIGYKKSAVEYSAMINI